MNKKILLLSLLCILSCQSIFKDEFFRNLQQESPPPPPPPPAGDGSPPPPPPPPPQEDPPHGDVPPQDDPEGDAPPQDDGSGPAYPMPPAPPNFDDQVFQAQTDINGLDGQIQQQQVLMDSNDIDISIKAANDLVELNFEKEKLNRKIFNINQEKQRFFQQQEFDRVQFQINSSQNQLNQLLGPNFQSIQNNLQKSLFSAQSADQAAGLIATAQQNIDALIVKALALNESNLVLLIQFKNNQVDSLNKNADQLTKDNASNTMISATGKQDAVAAINNMKSQADGLKKEIASATLEKTVRAKQIGDIKANFAVWCKQIQENKAGQALVEKAMNDLQKCVNDKSLQDQYNNDQQLLGQIQMQLKDASTSQQDVAVLNGQAENLNFKLKNNSVQQLKQYLQCNEFKFAFAQKQEANIKAQQAQMEKNKSVAISQQEKDFITAQQEKSKQGLLNIQEQYKQIAQEKIDLNAKLAFFQTTQFVQDQNVRQSRSDIDNSGQQLGLNLERIQLYKTNIQDQLNNSANDCKFKIDLIQKQLGNMKEFQEIVNQAKQINDKLSASNKAFADSSNVQINTNIADLAKQLAALKSTDEKAVAIQQQIAQLKAQLANIQQGQAKQLEQWTIQDKNIAGIVINFQNQLNEQLAQNRYQCNGEQLPQIADQISQIDVKIAQSKEQLASATTPEADKASIKYNYALLIVERQGMVNSQNRINLYQLNQDVNQIANNIKALSAQIAECNKTPASSKTSTAAETCTQAQQKLDAENAAAKQKAALKVAAEGLVSANSVGDLQQQKIEEQGKLAQDFGAQIQGQWQKIQQILQSNQDQVSSAATSEEKISILQQQSKNTKDFESLVNGLKDLHSKLAAAQKASYDSQQAKFTANIADLNKALAAQTAVDKKAAIQAQIDGMNALAAQSKSSYTQQSGDAANMLVKLGSFVQNNANQINNGILATQSTAFVNQINGIQQQIADLDNQINQLKGQLSGTEPVSESEKQKINDSIASISKQRAVLALNRDQISAQNASAVNTLSTNSIKDFTDKLAECKKQLASFSTTGTAAPAPSPAPPASCESCSPPPPPPTQQQVAEQCNQLQIQLDSLNVQIKQSAEQKIQLASTIGVQTVVVQQQQKIDDSNRQMGDLMKQIQNIFSKLMENRSNNEQQANLAPNCQERINILKNQLIQQKDMQAAQAQLKDLFAKLPAAQKAVFDNSSAQSAVVISDLTKKVAAQTNLNEKAILQKQLDEQNAMQAKNVAMSAQMSAEQTNQNGIVASLVETFVGGINNRIAESQSECHNNKLREQEGQMQQLQDQIAGFKGQLASATTSSEKGQLSANIDSAQAKWNLIKLDHEKLAILNVALVNQIVTFQLKNLNVQIAECNKILASLKVPNQEQTDKCKLIQGQIDAQNGSIKAQAQLKIQSEQQVTFLAVDVGLQSKRDESKKQLDEQNRLIKEQQGRINQYKLELQTQIDQQADLKAKVGLLNDQLAKSKEFDALLAQLKALLDKLPALQKAHGDNQMALLNARLANITKKIAEATLAKADTTELVKQQAEINTVLGGAKSEIANYSVQVVQITGEIATSSAVFQNSIKQQSATFQKANSENVQQEQQQQVAQLQTQIADLDSQIDSQSDPSQKLVLQNQKQNLLVQKYQGDNMQCKAFLDSVDARKLLINSQLTQQQAELAACNASLAANKDAALTASITQKCAGLKAGVDKCSADLKGIDEQKKKCDDMVANNNLNINSVFNQQQIKIANDQIAILKNNIASGIDVYINQQQLNQINEKMQLFANSQKEIQLKNLPSEISSLTVQIAAEKDAVKLAELNKQLAQKKADSASLVIEVSNFQAQMKKKLDEKLAQVQKQINDNEAAGKAKILAQAQIDAENLKNATAKQADSVKQKIDGINARIAKETKMLDQMKYECDMKDKKARQVLVDLQNKLIKNIKDEDAKQQASLLKKKQDQEGKVAADLKQVSSNKDQQLNQAKVENTVDGQRKIAIEQKPV